MPSGKMLAEELDESTDERFKRLNAAFGTLVDDYSLVKFVPLDVSDEDSIGHVLAHIDHAIQYGEDLEPHVRQPCVLPHRVCPHVDMRPHG